MNELILSLLYLTCGTDPSFSISERIKNCSSLPESTRQFGDSPVVWKLVTRNRDVKGLRTYDVWLNSYSGEMWGDVIDGVYTHAETVMMEPQNRWPLEEKICRSMSGAIANGNIRDANFRLPSLDEFKDSLSEGLAWLGPQNEKPKVFWTNTHYDGVKDEAPYFYTYSTRGIFNANHGSGRLSVRCIGNVHSGL